MFWEGGWECCVRNVILDLFPHPWGEAGHVERGGGCFTIDFCRFPMNFAGSLAREFALISSLSTRHFQKTSPSEPGYPFAFFITIFTISLCIQYLFNSCMPWSTCVTSGAISNRMNVLSALGSEQANTALSAKTLPKRH